MEGQQRDGGARRETDVCVVGSLLLLLMSVSLTSTCPLNCCRLSRCPCRRVVYHSVVWDFPFSSDGIEEGVTWLIETVKAGGLKNHADAGRDRRR